jgi:hypothetical protein
MYAGLLLMVKNSEHMYVNSKILKLLVYALKHQQSKDFNGRLDICVPICVWNYVQDSSKSIDDYSIETINIDSETFQQ